VVLALSHGSIQTRPFDSDEVRIAGFDEYAMALPMQGSESLPARNWRGVYEMGPSEFPDDWSVARQDRRRSGEWAAEAAKRFGLPALSIAHTLLAMALVLTFGNVTGRRGASTSLVIIAVPATHIFFLVGLETLLRADARFALLLAALIAAEIAVAAALISKRHMSLGPMRRLSAYERVTPKRESLAA
jgi:lipopolysaccharide export system permease protein